jgi:hypothetical protein
MADRLAGAGASLPRIAFLILVHRDPSHLARLVGRLAAEGCHCFVHCDAKVSAEPFARVLEGLNATLVSDRERIAVNWCGYGMVEATHALLREAFRPDCVFDRFCLLSGSDYPLKPVATIRQAAAQHREILRVDRRLDPRGAGPFDRCASRIYLGGIGILNERTGLPGLRALAKRLQRVIPRAARPPMPVYYGPSWWMLTREAASYLVEEMEAHPDLSAFFRWTRSPDEMVVQTVLKASPFASDITFDATRPDFHDDPLLPQATHYVDWDRPNPDAPRTLVLEDLDRLCASPALFARKFDSNRSAVLVDRLDQISRSTQAGADPAEGGELHGGE